MTAPTELIEIYTATDVDNLLDDERAARGTHEGSLDAHGLGALRDDVTLLGKISDANTVLTAKLFPPRFSDTFDRANGNLASPWRSVFTGYPRIINNAIQGQPQDANLNSPINGAVIPVGSTDQRLRYTLDVSMNATYGEASVLMRYDSSGNGLLIQCPGVGLAAYAISGNGATYTKLGEVNMADGNPTLPVGNLPIEAVLVGAILTIKAAGKAVLVIPNVPLTSGINAGVRMSGDLRMLDFAADVSLGDDALLRNAMSRPAFQVGRDAFDRADAAMLGAAELGGNWVNDTNAGRIVSNQAAGSGGAARDVYVLPVSANNGIVTAQITVPTSGTHSAGLALRYGTTGGKSYTLVQRSTSGQIDIIRNTGGANSILMNNNVPPPGRAERLTAIMDGSTLRVLLDGLNVITCNLPDDASSVYVQPGIMATGEGRVDSWAAYRQEVL